MTRPRSGAKRRTGGPFGGTKPQRVDAGVGVGYGFTAEALAELATRMAQGSIEALGTCAPWHVVEPREFLEVMNFSINEVEPT